MPPVVTTGGFIFYPLPYREVLYRDGAKKRGAVSHVAAQPLSCLYEERVLLLILCVGEEVARGEAYEVVDTTYELRLIALEVEDIDGIGLVG